jgi:hypothetical protein
LVRHRDKTDVEFRPKHLAAKFEMLHDLARIGGRRRHDEMAVAETRGRAVVHGEAIFA